ncbi:hypothetical protein SAMD00023519_01757 [Listeria monocytogenes]|nr:hypothetical protein SAMD00023519_01757 [Listeria monocytogenes]
MVTNVANEIVNLKQQTLTNLNMRFSCIFVGIWEWSLNCATGKKTCGTTIIF